MPFFIIGIESKNWSVTGFGKYLVAVDVTTLTISPSEFLRTFTTDAKYFEFSILCKSPECESTYKLWAYTLVDINENEITGDYVDFSLNNNLLIISKNVVYSNQKNLLKADALEIDIETKNTKIFMYEEEKKVKIKSLKNHGNN